MSNTHPVAVRRRSIRGAAAALALSLGAVLAATAIPGLVPDASAASCTPAVTSASTTLDSQNFQRVRTGYLTATKSWQRGRSAKAVGRTRILWTVSARYSSTVTYRACVNGVAGSATASTSMTTSTTAWSTASAIRIVRNVSSPVAKAKAKAKAAASTNSRNVLLVRVRNSAASRAYANALDSAREQAADQATNTPAPTPTPTPIPTPTPPPHVADSWHWPSPTRLAAMHGGPASISCPTSTFCAVVDNKGAALTYDGSSWSTPEPVNYTAPQGFMHLGFTGVSCPSPTFCMAVDGNGGYMTYNGSNWSTLSVADAEGAPLGHLSCPTATYCLAANGRGQVLTYNGSGWSAPVPLTPNGVSALDCFAADQCFVGDTKGNVYSKGGNGWSAADPLFTSTNSGGVTGISCPSPSFCMATTEGHYSTYLPGTGWSAPGTLPPYVTEVSCTSATFCAAVAQTRVALYDGTSWTGPIYVAGYNDVTRISCAVPTFCAFTGGSGASGIYDGSTWQPPTMIDKTVESLAPVSCPTDTFCLEGEADAQQRTFNGVAWSAPQPSGLSYRLGDLSCSSPSFCGGQANGAIVTWNGSRWQQAEVSGTSGYIPSLGGASCVEHPGSYPTCWAIDPNGKIVNYDADSGFPMMSDGVETSGPFAERFRASCVGEATGDFCVFTGNQGHAVVLTPDLHVTDATLGGDLIGISCVSDTFCMAADTTGYFFVYNGSTWSTGTQVNAGQTVTRLECASPTACVMTDAGGGVRTWDGLGWSERSEVFPHGQIRDASCPVGGSTCTVVGDDAGYQAVATVLHP